MLSALNRPVELSCLWARCSRSQRAEHHRIYRDSGLARPPHLYYRDSNDDTRRRFYLKATTMPATIPEQLFLDDLGQLDALLYFREESGCSATLHTLLNESVALQP